MLLSFNPSNFINNLHYMGKGMLAIGVVMLILILVTALLNKLSSKKK